MSNDVSSILKHVTKCVSMVTIKRLTQCVGISIFHEQYCQQYIFTAYLPGSLVLAFGPIKYISCVLGPMVMELWPSGPKINFPIGNTLEKCILPIDFGNKMSR